jgi:tRNA G18 (ribose-2'-O)-methylase SpoU
MSIKKVKTVAKDAIKTIIILPDIRSVHNVGSVFRTADAAGVSKIFLTGYTPAPRDRFGREREDISKVALGAEKSVEWEQVENTLTLLKRLRKEGVQIVAVEQDARAINYKKFKPAAMKRGKGNKDSPQSIKSVAFIFGNETKGLPKNLLAQCDDIIEIPMRGIKESLNVSVSVGIILFGLIK